MREIAAPDVKELTDQYAETFRVSAAPGYEHVYAHGLIDAITATTVHYSNAAQLQRALGL